ncbi:hypothetical protein GXW83_10485 [Streptacidiphilus sp. PB12-B1b]|uniref:hypothetical protein n=1 Tax=Streptacidiphilus sp. PB12-B1b TaxID=2705012 RepID=UPI0015F8F620|nr:hypothetical protein [Streptacidiphilus sp. PB12-B1b]QMU76098.1 hypothetical protein GXW83_10485 [Streptacidiphilus sp. PB12-B1b]
MQDVLLGTGAGGAGTVSAPVGRRAALGAPLLLVVAFAVAAPLSMLLAVVGGSRDPVFAQTVAPALLAAAALAVGCLGRPGPSLVVGPVFWLFWDGFVVHRSGVLGWDGALDATRLGLLVAAGLAGGLLAALAPHLRAAGARLRAPAVAAGLRRASLEPFRPVPPPRTHSAFWN